MSSPLDAVLRWLDRPRVRTAFVLLWCLGWVVVGLLSLLPLPFGSSTRMVKLGHFAVYTAMVVGALTFTRGPMALALVAVTAASIGALLEVGQGLLPYRHMALTDVAINAAGAGAGLLLGWAVLFGLRRWRRPPASAGRRGPGPEPGLGRSRLF